MAFHLKKIKTQKLKVKKETKNLNHSITEGLNDVSKQFSVANEIMPY